MSNSSKIDALLNLIEAEYLTKAQAQYLMRVTIQITGDCLRDYGITDEECTCPQCDQQEELNECSCDMQRLLSAGCNCGAMLRERGEKKLDK